MGRVPTSIEGRVGLWGLKEGIDRSIRVAICLLRFAVWGLQIMPLLPMTFTENPFFLEEWRSGMYLQEMLKIEADRSRD